jgi:hypothetical protein
MFSSASFQIGLGNPRGSNFRVIFPDFPFLDREGEGGSGYTSKKIKDKK